MEVRCVNSKDYKLTNGRLYQAVERNGMYELVNDNGSIVLYSKTLFDTVVVEAIVEAVEEEQIIREDTDEQILETIEVVYDQDDDNGDSTISISGNINGHPIDKLIYIDDSESGNSCGIREVEGLNSLSGIIDNICNGRTELKKSIVKLCIKEIISTIEAIFITFSTNTNDDRFHIIEDSLDELSSWSDSGRNPNSGNDIKLWVMKKED